MSRGPYHPPHDEGGVLRKDGGRCGRSKKKKSRDKAYFVRLNEAWFNRLESLLDVPTQTATAIPGCSNRADLLQLVFGNFLALQQAARDLRCESVEDFLADGKASLEFVRKLNQPTNGAPALLTDQTAKKQI